MLNENAALFSTMILPSQVYVLMLGMEQAKKKANDIIWPIKDIFPDVMYGCETWTIKKAERRWIDAFELWC